MTNSGVYPVNSNNPSTNTGNSQHEAQLDSGNEEEQEQDRRSRGFTRWIKSKVKGGDGAKEDLFRRAKSPEAVGSQSMLNDGPGGETPRAKSMDVRRDLK
jgi:hypothetical protein